MLFVVTNRKLVKNGEFLVKIEEVVAGGADAIILREKDLTHEELLFLAKDVNKIVKPSKTKLIINQSIEAATEIGASGIHLSFKPFENYRPKFNGLIGVSIHTVEEAKKAEGLGANYLLAGHIYNTNCKKGKEPRGIDFLKDIKNSVKIPVVAIGGINEDNYNEIFQSGVEGIAMMSSIMEADNCFEKVRELKYNIMKKNYRAPNLI